MVWPILLFVLVDLFVGGISQSYSSSSCSYDRMRRCKEDIQRSLQKRINDMNRQDMISHCGIVREDFNCLLQQTRCLSSESERQRNSDVIRSASVYLRDGCDSLGGKWRDSSCFIGDGMKNCESSYPVGSYSSYSSDSCRKYNQFQECVMNTIKNRCRPDEDKLSGQYLVDKAQDLAWTCEDTGHGDRDRYGSSDRDSYGGDRYDRDRNRDQYRDRDRDRDQDRYGSRDRDRNYGAGGDITCCRNERCDNYRMQQCRDSLSRVIDDRMTAYQDSQKCRKIRDDFNCLLWQTSCLPREERDRVSDVFRRARDFISRNCDSYGRWSENSCYKSSEMQRCETYLSNTRGGANYESCRAYNSFKDCMQDQLRRGCTREDELFQGAYLVDKAQEMSWQCANDGASPGRGTSDSRFSYLPTDRRNPYDYKEGSVFGSYDDNNPPHLDDDDSMCLSRMTSMIDNCKRDLNEKRRLLQDELDFDAKQRKLCCSARQYRQCLYDASRRVCLQERTRVVESLMGKYRYELQSDQCRRIYDSECSAAPGLLSSVYVIGFTALAAAIPLLIFL